MANRYRILHNVQRWEDLLELPDPLQEFPPDVTPENPLEIFIAREVLATVVESSIAAIHANRERLDTTPELKAETAELLRQRERFLAWLQRHPTPNIYVALYPKSEFELVGEESDEPGDDESGGSEGDEPAGDDLGGPTAEEGET